MAAYDVFLIGASPISDIVINDARKVMEAYGIKVLDARIVEDYPEAINDCWSVIACLDHSSVASHWCLGYAFAMEIPALTFNDREMGLFNKHIKETIDHHFKSFSEFQSYMDRFHNAFTMRSYGRYQEALDELRPGR